MPQTCRNKRKQKIKETTYLVATHQPAHLAAQRCAGPCKPFASSPPGRQGGDAGVRELATAPPACRPRPWTPGRAPRRRPDPLDTSIRPLALSLALSRHGRRTCRRTADVAALSVVLAPRHRAQKLRRPPLLRASQAPSARLPRSLCTDLARLRHRRRSPLPSP